MGSTAVEMNKAKELCERETLASMCEQLASGFRMEGHAHEVTVSDFAIDRTEVTVETYGRCVSAGACAAPGFAPFDMRFDRPELPVTHVSWEDATRYCAWQHGRLPTEAEWEYAARGTARRTFPWGNVYGSRLANHGSLAFDNTDASDGYSGLAPVGSYPSGATPGGILDLAGNAAEWVADWFDVDDSGHGYAQGPGVNPKGPTGGLLHVFRGGSYQDGGYALRSAARALVLGGHPMIAQRSPGIGFRCAYDKD